jgi:hypothetical protein
MFPNDLYPDDNRGDIDASGIFEITHSATAEHSERIIRWLPLLAANDFLDQDDNLPPVA